MLTDLDLPVSLADLHEPRPDRQAIEELFEELEFRTLRTRLFDLYGDDTAGAAPDTIEAPEFTTLTDAAALEEFFAAGSGVRSALAIQQVPGRIGEDAAEPDEPSGKRPDAVLADPVGVPEKLI